MIVNGYFLNRRSLRHRVEDRLVLSLLDRRREEPGGSGGPVSGVGTGGLLGLMSCLQSTEYETERSDVIGSFQFHL
jgi:hypothetical protein